MDDGILSIGPVSQSLFDFYSRGRKQQLILLLEPYFHTAPSCPSKTVDVSNPFWAALLKFDYYSTDIVLGFLIFMGVADFCLGNLDPTQCGYVLGPGALLVKCQKPEWFPRHEESARV